MPSSVMAELEDHLNRYASPTYVFPHPDGTCLRAEEWRRRIWRPAVTAAGLAPLRAHDLKHTLVISPAHMPLRDMSYVA